MGKLDIKKLFSEFNTLNILIVGDVMLDSYVWGKVDRISPEAPVPVLSCTDREDRLGGAANVALNVKSMGATPILCSVIGNDESGVKVKSLMNDNSFMIEGLVETNERRTTVKTRFVSGSQHMIRVDEEDVFDISKDIENEMLGKIYNIIQEKKIDALVFQDYDKGVLTSGLIGKVTDMCKSNSIPILVDPKKKNFFEYKNVDLFKPNFKEFTEGLNIKLDKSDNESIHNQALKFMSDYNIKSLLVTLSENGVLVSNSKGYEHIPAVLRKISDVSGAGDTVISVASLCLAANLSMKHIAEISNRAGGIVCEVPVVVPIDKNKLQTECIEIYEN
ncbi:MAG: PfkB family carbohydrate kinase [Marinifilaceae bacterium]|nr:PfkB family carbohydrate kinase [Marinifilaceae bacterium]